MTTDSFFAAPYRLIHHQRNEFKDNSNQSKSDKLADIALE